MLEKVSVLGHHWFYEDVGDMKSVHIFILFQNDSHLETDHPAIAHYMRLHFALIVNRHGRFKRLGGYENLFPATGTNDRYVQHGRGGAGKETKPSGIVALAPHPISAICSPSHFGPSNKVGCTPKSA